MRRSEAPPGYVTRLAYHLCSFSASDSEFKIGILLPVTEKKREFGQEAVVAVARGGNSLGIGVAIEATLQSLCAAHEFLPGLEVVWIVQL